MDDADLEVGPLGRKAPLFFQPADVRPGQGGFTCIVTPTEDITVVRRPVLGIGREAYVFPENKTKKQYRTDCEVEELP